MQYMNKVCLERLMRMQKPANRITSQGNQISNGNKERISREKGKDWSINV